jgi:thiosulfate/3-mercaptopyruvate sulfurtransferase
MYTSLINTSDLNTHLHDPDWVVVDCRFSLGDVERGRRDYFQDHIPGAFYAHLDEDLSGKIIPGRTGRHPLPEEDASAKLFSRWGIDEKVQVVAYDDASGMVASRLWWMLRWLGHDAVAVLDGGWPAWVKSGYPTDTEPSQRSPRNFIPRQRDELAVDADFVNAVKKDPQYLVIDSRAPERYKGEVEPIDQVAGHIPGAVNLPHEDVAGTDGALLSSSELKDHFQSTAGQWPPEKTIFYCGSGVSACHNILAYYHAGLGEARLYPGSWSEWITDGGREVARIND